MSTPGSPLDQLLSAAPPDSSPAASPSGSPLDQLLANPPAQPPTPPAPKVVVPDAGRIPGVISFGNAVTPTEAAGGIAAGAAIGAAPLLASAAPSAIEALTAAAKSHPIVAKLLSKGLESIGWGSGAELAHEAVKLATDKKK
jgi:hypothetical protein